MDVSIWADQQVSLAMEAQKFVAPEDLVRTPWLFVSLFTCGNRNFVRIPCLKECSPWVCTRGWVGHSMPGEIVCNVHITDCGIKMILLLHTHALGRGLHVLHVRLGHCTYVIGYCTREACLRVEGGMSSCYRSSAGSGASSVFRAA